MIRFRIARYCNLKLLLIFLVIYGHLIEPYIGHIPFYRMLYRLIYTFHMPMFVFLSGLFLNDKDACRKQFAKQGVLYIILQSAAYVLGNGKVHPLTPYWHLWYLLSYCTWSAFGYIWYCSCNQKLAVPVLIVSIIVGCFVGYLPMCNRVLSISRTVVFFPYFWLGLICKHDYPWENLKPLGIPSAILALTLFFTVGGSIPTSFLYQASPFRNMDNGIIFRILCYLLGLLFGLFFLSLVPNCRWFFTKAGIDTMPAYLLHAPAVLLLREIIPSGLLFPLVSIFLIILSYKLTLLHCSMYGIIEPKRRDRNWPRSK